MLRLNDDSFSVRAMEMERLIINFLMFGIKQLDFNVQCWILMSCQPHRVTSGQSNSGHKQMHISKLFSHVYHLSVKSVYKTNHKPYNKRQIQIFEDLVPSVLPLLKEHIRLGHAGIVDHSV